MWRILFRKIDILHSSLPNVENIVQEDRYSPLLPSQCGEYCTGRQIFFTSPFPMWRILQKKIDILHFSFHNVENIVEEDRYSLLLPPQRILQSVEEGKGVKSLREHSLSIPLCKCGGQVRNSKMVLHYAYIQYLGPRPARNCLYQDMVAMPIMIFSCELILQCLSNQLHGAKYKLLQFSKMQQLVQQDGYEVSFSYSQDFIKLLKIPFSNHLLKLKLEQNFVKQG